MLDLHQQIPSGGQARDEVDAVNKPSQRCSPTANTDEPKPLDLLVQVSQCSTDIDLRSLYINCLVWFRLFLYFVLHLIKIRLSVQGGGGSAVQLVDAAQPPGESSGPSLRSRTVS
jgi:hypothetical protein